jgi:L-fuconolactonase
MSVDAHFHCWQLARGDYGWLKPSLTPIYRDVSISDWQAQAVPRGVTGGVLVQAAPTDAETEFLLGQADAHPCVLGVVGWTDLAAANAPARIRQLAGYIQLKGLRPMLQDIDDAEWILQPELAPALNTLIDCDLVFDALITPRHLPHLLTLAARYPSLRIVVDHAGKPNIASNEWQPWADDVARLASSTSAFCKLSGLLTEAGPEPLPRVIQPWARHVLDCFGTDRVVWGSDWPVLELSSTYPQWWAETEALLTLLGKPAQHAVMDANARRLYRLASASPV